MMKKCGSPSPRYASTLSVVVVLALVTFATQSWAQEGGDEPGADVSTPDGGSPASDGLQVRFDLWFGGGTVMAWDTPEEAGNSYGGGVGVNLLPGLNGLYGIRIGLMAAGVLPDSRFQGHFGVLWVDVQYRPFVPWYHLEPYLVVGAGLAFPDRGDPEILPGLPAATQWSTSHQFVGMAGIGLSYGAPTGLFIAADLRAINLQHGAVNLLAGYRF